MDTKYELGRRTKNVTNAPNFCLKIIGRMDAKKGETVATAHYDRYLEKCVSIENEECLAAEAALKGVRVKGAQELASIAKNSKLLPTMPSAVEENKPWDVLENRRRANAVANAQTAIETGRENLYTINETILNGASILDERISRIRKKASAKLEAYLKGLRAGGLTSFDPEVSFSDKASEMYYGRHKKLDEAIAAAAQVPEFEEVK